MKEDLRSVTSCQADEVGTLPFGREVEVDCVYTNPFGTIVNKGDIKAYCQDGEFFLDLKETLSYPRVVSETNTDVDVMENFINYPNPCTANFGKNNVCFGEASVEIYDKKNRENCKDMAIKGRGFIKTESITTPTSTFDCVKVKYSIAARSLKSKGTITGYGYEWCSPNVGLVRTEQYDKSNVLQSYTVLEELK